MLFQTLVQLNILMLATPALAGWSLLPLAQPGVVRAACVGFQGRTVEAIAPKVVTAETVHGQRTVPPQDAVSSHFAVPFVIRPTAQSSTFVVTTSAIVVSFNPFPHATRAP